MDKCNTMEGAIELVAELAGVPNDIALLGRAKCLARQGLLEVIGGARAGRGRKQMLHGHTYSSFVLALSLSVLGMMPLQIVEAMRSPEARRIAARRLAICAELLTEKGVADEQGSEG